MSLKNSQHSVISEITRQYSIASIANDRTLDLVIRRVSTPKGPGLVSGWLTSEMPINAIIELRIRTNPGFRRPNTFPVIMIASGTGIASLRAHLKECEAAESYGHWFIFGERDPKYDALFSEDIDHWIKAGVIARFDGAWSSDPNSPRYVQHVIGDNTKMIRSWVLAGSSIMICGSFERMGQGVEHALKNVLGDASFERLRMQGLYRRDVY